MRWMAPTDGLRDIAVARADLVGALGDVGEQRLQILQVEQQQPLLVGDRKAMLMTPSCASLRFISRDSSSGPISETVARIGWPCSPNRSQKITGNCWNS